jgi:hypothetical protein
MTDIQLAEKEVKHYKGLDVLAKSEGGETLISNMKERIASDVEMLCSLLKGSEVDIRAAIAQLKADVYLYRVLLNAEQNAKIAVEELELLLKQQKED